MMGYYVAIKNGFKLFKVALPNRTFRNDGVFHMALSINSI